MVGDGTMSQVSQEDRARRRTLPVIGIMVGVLFGCPILLGFLLVILPQSADPVDSIQVEETEYVLTCLSTLDGPVVLEIHECESGNEESCRMVEQGYDMGLPCEVYTMHMRDDLISVETESGNVLFTHDPR
jgi:hypothetical protein